MLNHKKTKTTSQIEEEQESYPWYVKFLFVFMILALIYLSLKLYFESGQEASLKNGDIELKLTNPESRAPQKDIVDERQSLDPKGHIHNGYYWYFDKEELRTWDSANEICNELIFDKLKKWKLPTIDILKLMPDSLCENCVGFWSSTKDQSNNQYALLFDQSKNFIYKQKINNDPSIGANFICIRPQKFGNSESTEKDTNIVSEQNENDTALRCDVTFTDTLR